MLNSIQSQNNARPAFGCSRCPKGEMAIRSLVKLGADVNKASQHMDKVAPTGGKYMPTINIGEKALIDHDSLLDLAVNQIAGICSMLKLI